MSRAYHSPLRQQRVEQTKRRIVEAALAFLHDRDPGELTIPKLAELAGVTPPTVYRYYPCIDAVLEAVMPEALLLLFGPQRIPTTPRAVFTACERHGRLVRTLVNSATWDRLRDRSQGERNEALLDALAERAPGVPREELRIYGGPAVAFSSPYMWKMIRDTWGLSPEEAIESAEWARDVLLAALADRGSREVIDRGDDDDR